MGELAFAIDCSGSIGEDELNQFAAEIQTVHEDHKPKKIHLIYFDSKVCHYEAFGRDDELHVEPHGGGGTDFAPVWDHMVEHDIEPVATVFLTDLCCSSYGDEQNHPVLWVCNYDSAEAPPFGEVVMM
jgi:predicted metal-dependent peptidase